MTKLLAPVWSKGDWVTENIKWPDLSKNPHLNKVLSEKNDPSFMSAFSKVKNQDQSVRSRQRFKNFDSMDLAGREFVTEGFYTTVVDIDKLISFLSKVISNVKGMKSTNSHYSYGRSEFIKPGSESFKELNRILVGDQISRLASEMIGFSVELSTALVHYSDDTDIHFQQVLSDVNYNTKLQALHRDPKPNIKAILYLEDVGENDGPFSYIPYSHRWGCSYEERMASHANCTYNYLDSPEKRDKFLSLPPKYRFTSIVGSITDDSDETSGYLLNKEEKFIGEAGSLILFPAAGLLHRGGACGPGGTRLNLQITFR